MATATSPVPDDRSTKRQKGDESGNSSHAGPDSCYPSRQPPQHPNQMYSHPGAYMGMGGGGPGGPYMGGPGMPPYGQYGGPHGPPPHLAGPYGGMYGGGGPPPPHVRGHGSPERPGRPSGGPGSWNGYRGGPPPPPPHGGRKEDKDGPSQSQHASSHPGYAGGWVHPQSWQPGHPYGPPPGYGGHVPMSGGPGMYGQGSRSSGPPPGGWSSSGHGGHSHEPQALPPSARSSGPMPPLSPHQEGDDKSPPRSRPRPDSANPNSRLIASPHEQQPAQQERPDSSSYCMDVGSVQGGRGSVTQDYGEEGSSLSGSKGRGNYKCGRCGVPKKGHICPYQPKLKRRPDEPPPETRNAAVQVEMDEFMTLRRLNIRIQGFPESYATEPFMGASMVGAEPYSSSECGGFDVAGMMTNLDDRCPRRSPPVDTNLTSPKDRDDHSPTMPPNGHHPSPKREEDADMSENIDPTEKEEKTDHTA